MVNLFTTLYTEKSPERDEELLTCLRLNCQLGTLVRVYVLEEAPHRLPESEKVRVIRVAARPTFNDVFSAVREYSSTDDLNFITNTDIYLCDESVRLCQRYLRENEVFALSRWEVSPDRTRVRLNWGSRTQDVWVFRGHPRQVQGEFYMGKLGCDGRLAWELTNAGHRVRNPCRDIRVYHLHNSQIRNYSMTSADQVPEPHLGVLQESIRLDRLAWWSVQRGLRKILSGLGVRVDFPYEVVHHPGLPTSGSHGCSGIGARNSPATAVLKA